MTERDRMAISLGLVAVAPKTIRNSLRFGVESKAFPNLGKFPGQFGIDVLVLKEESNESGLSFSR